MDQNILLQEAGALLHRAVAAGFILTISNEPRKPLAMGNYRARIDLRPLREPARTLVDDLEAAPDEDALDQLVRAANIGALRHAWSAYTGMEGWGEAVHLEMNRRGLGREVAV